MNECDRRTVLRGLAATSAGAMVTGCGGSAGPPANRDPQTLARVTTSGAAAAVRILPDQNLVIGIPAYVRFTVQDAAGRLIAVPLDDVQVQLLEGEELLEFNEERQAVGLAEGTIRAAITVAGVSSAVETITVVATAPARRRQAAVETTVVQVPVGFPAVSEQSATRSARVTLFGAGPDGEDLTAVVDRVLDGAHEVVAVLDHCVPGDWDLGVEFFDAVGGTGLLGLLVYAVVNAAVRSLAFSGSDLCFIATELYGGQSPEVGRLRAWRDTTLLPRAWGRCLVAGYYATSPRLVRLMRRWSWLRGMAAWAVERVLRRIR